MYILIHNSKGSFSIELPAAFIQVNISGIYSIKEEDDYLFKTNQEEFFLNASSRLLDDISYKEVKAVIIDKNLGGSGWSRAIGLAGHIACTDYSKCQLNKLPIILTDWNDLDIEDPSLKNTVINNIFQTEGFYFRKYESLFSIKSDKMSGLINYVIDIEVKKLKPIDIEKINISSPYDNRHQTTNEWGAMRLASNFGIFESIKFTYPKHLYFKYLSRFIKINNKLPDSTLHGLFKKILLIDDNADCGWIELLENVHNCSVDKRVSSTEVLAWQNTTPEKFNQYDLIYLDLYLEKGKSDSTNALSALKFIKGNFPHIPVVIFTASDKAWNLDEVLERGADNMYIKESPLYYRNEEYSLKNYNDFTATIKHVYEKYKILRPYWIQIRKIISHGSFRAIENSPRKLRDRIEERLRMFYGLLKKGYEQWDYDKQTFFYSDYELAFMTLWSVLNEIQEAFYDKTNISLVHSNGITYHHHPNPRKTPLSKKQKWVLKGTGKIFINNIIAFSGCEPDGTPKLKKPGKFDLLSDISTSDLKYDNWNAPYYSIESTGLFSTNEYIIRSLHAQIAYILLNRSSHTSTQLINLYKLNEIRNSMYLTHGDSFDANFYNQTEKTKRSVSTITPNGSIKDLFDLVAYLITGDPSNVIVI